MKVDIFNEDCVTGMASRLEPQSVDLCVTSIPFGALFMYSGKPEDIGNNADGVDMRASPFGLHMRFFIEQLKRVLKPGRNACIHIQQLLRYVNQHGYMGRRDFRGAVIDMFAAGGLEWIGEVVIPKNPQVIAQRLSLHSLLFKTARENSTKLAPAVNDYVMIFQQPGEADPPVRALRGDDNPHGWMKSDEWICWAKGVWDNIRETDVLDGWKSARQKDEEKHVCLARGSLVLTRSGYKPIESVAVGELVLTHRGVWRPVLAKACNGLRRAIRVEAQGVPGLIATPSHLLYARSHVGRGRWPGMRGGITQARKRAMRADPTWLRADATLGSYLCLPLPKVEHSQYSAHEWWIIGRWLGDGHIDARGRLHISCGRGEVDDLVYQLGPRAGAVTTRRTGYQIAINDRDLGLYPATGARCLRAFLKLCGAGAANKKLPAEALTLDADKSEALLSGYLSADGHYSAQYNRWSASSVSRALLLGMAIVAQRARGVVASVYAGRPPRKHTIEGRSVNAKQEWVLSIPPKGLSGFITTNEIGWKKVRSIEHAGEVEVWDLQIEGDESFIAEGCAVHNCPLQLEVIRRCVRLYSAPGDLVLDPFMGIGSTAYVCVEQGRRAVGFELKESYHALALRNLNKQWAQMEENKRDLFNQNWLTA